MQRRRLLPILLMVAGVALLALAVLTRIRLLSYAALVLAATGVVLWSRRDTD